METPFNMMIVGMTWCGKTYYLLEKDYNDSAMFYPISCDQGSVDVLLKYIVDNFKGTNSLIILDTTV